MNANAKLIATRKVQLAISATNDMQLDTAVTLTTAFDWETQQSFSRRIRWFANRLNTTLFGKKFTRYKVAVPMIGTIEGGGASNKRIHTHLSMRRPTGMSIGDFEAVVQESWRRVNGARCPRVEVTEIYSDGWTGGYTSKDLRPHNMDRLDVPNICTGVWRDYV
jgi:hypothetical protein